MNVLLLGKVGQVGYELGRTLAPLGELTSVDYPDIDFTKPDSVRHWVREKRPQVIVNAVAYTAVDKAESDRDTAMKINSVAPGVLAEEARKLNALLVHYSTDYVFDGTKGTPYLETDTPNPLSVYGSSKLAGDVAIASSGCNHLIFRLCWVYGARGQNFMLTMMKLAREREILRVVCDQTGAPTWSRLIAEATSQALSRIQAHGDWSAFNGVYHMSAAGTTNWHEFAQAIIGAMPAEGIQCRSVEAIPSSAYPTAARRPAYSVMSNEKLQRTFGLALPDWRRGLELVLDKT